MSFIKTGKFKPALFLLLFLATVSCGSKPTCKTCQNTRTTSGTGTSNQAAKTPAFNESSKAPQSSNLPEVPTFQLQLEHQDILHDHQLTRLNIFQYLDSKSIGREILDFYQSHLDHIQADIRFLLNKIQDPTLFNDKDFNDKDISNQLLLKLKADHITASKAWKLLKAKSKIANWTSMRKLAFSKYDSNPKKRKTGLLIDAASMFQHLRLTNSLTPKKLEFFELGLTQNQKTVFRVMCIYMYLVSNNVDSLTKLNDGSDFTDYKNLKLVHIGEYPNSPLASQLLGDFGLRYDDMLLYPNIGYVYGGHTKDKVCRGLDCSSLISDIFDLQYRVTTATIAKAATQQIQLPNEINKPSQKLTKYPNLVAELHDKFETLMTPTSSKRKLAELKLGDVLNWNAGYGGNRSHVVFFIKQLTDSSCIVFEATRSDDKDYEGIMFRKLNITKEPLQFVLRAKSHTSQNSD